ncbi:NYN domain-containing protein [Pseudooctadecabacter jejudonensis]|uniref:NYN domain protein n=1 Tax=Pseudooctadecabacter jejudonensis TaxID=1391910 RepID=A0A1Y5RJ00_9RHOB|nr:NYN domain-containing protein [Pseudooctadecabacter jejudonensis]SLN17298.1 NYN domain protein [Pseudooctadecabacter jejudonensis]
MADERPLLAVLIDADNVPAKHAEAILKEVSRIGEPALRRVYGDWSSDMLRGWSKIIPSLGLVARQETANTRQKNASDIGLVIDAMDILHTSKFDGFVLVSSDSDFTALANRLREDGLTVIGIGEAKTPDSLRNVCNRFILIENLTGDATPAAKPKAQTTELAQAYDLFVEAMNRIDIEDDWYNLGGVGSMILAAHPDFDPRSYGHAKLSGLARALTGIETKKSGNNLLIRLKD